RWFSGISCELRHKNGAFRKTLQPHGRAIRRLRPPTRTLRPENAGRTTGAYLVARRMRCAAPRLSQYMPIDARFFPRGARADGAGARVRLMAPLTAALVSLCMPAHGQPLPAPDQELLRQQERERALRDQLEARPDARLQAASGIE